MARLKIDYGIDLGTTNSSICRMENGEPTIKKTDTLKDTMPSCVAFTKKRSIKVGDSAYNDMKADKRAATKKMKATSSNTCVEFKRSMGSDTKYVSSFMDKEYTSEELSAEVLKTLKSFITDENIKSAVITVPAKFTINQKDATMRAAKLAGIEHCELLQEPIAASMAFGLSNQQKDGYWMVFDFGGGTFDAALLKVNDGIMQVFDTDGDNYLGGKNLDYTIVDEIIIPYLQKNYVIEDILGDEEKRKVLRDAMKTYAEDAKNQLSFKEKEDIISNLGELGGDDEGTELELDLTITQAEISEVFKPVFQKAVTICKSLLERNNMTGNQLNSLILVGGPTYCPVVRKLLQEQITSNVNTSIDPMTAVARGAALYACTIDNNAKKEHKEDNLIMIDVSYEATTVEMMEFVTLKLLPDKCKGVVPNELYAELIRGDKAWSSGKIEINKIGDLVECQLSEGKPNSFSITVYDEKGKKLPCFPAEITIIQGSKVGSALLPYSIGIEVYDSNKDKLVFTTFKGLERNQLLPATGVYNGLKTTNDLRPGVASDFIKIPIYQGDEGAEGIKAIYFEHVYIPRITGDDISALLPSGSDVDITIKVDRSEGMFMEVFFPALGYTKEIEIDKTTVQKELSEEDLQNEICKAKSELQKLKLGGDSTEELEAELEVVQKELINGDQKKQVLQHLKESLRKIDKMDSEGEWDRIEKELRDKFEMLEVDNGKYGNSQTTVSVNVIRARVDQIILKKDIQSAKEELEIMFVLNFQLAKVEYYIAWIHDWHTRFTTKKWKDTNRARQLVNQGIEIINTMPSTNNLEPIISQLFDLLPDNDLPEGAAGLLKK